MAKRRKKRKSKAGSRLALLLALCVAGAALWHHYELPVPETLAQRALTVRTLAAEKLAEVRSGLADLLKKLPPELREPLVPPEEDAAVTLGMLPAYDGNPYVELDGNQPAFTEEEKAGTASYETYASLDLLGRCGPAEACVGQELMPTEERGAIGMVKPSGWHTVRYDGVVDGKYLYNRCHLIGYQLTGENANERNLILSLKRNRM